MAKHKSPLTFVVLVGIPGAGKTFITNALCAPHFRVSFDKTENRSRNDMDKLMLQAVKAKRHIVVDAANTRITQRRRYIALAKKNGYKVYALVADTSMDLAGARMKHRGRKVPKGAMENYANEMQWPKKEEGFDEVLVMWDDFDPRGEEV